MIRIVIKKYLSGNKKHENWGLFKYVGCFWDFTNLAGHNDEPYESNMKNQNQRGEIGQNW
jgi:hypothetical protein